MKVTFPGAEKLSTSLLEAGQSLMSSCNGCLLPFDTYCMSAAVRAIDSVHAYEALAEIDNFFGCCIMARSQLDSLARLNGVMNQPDPHALAQQLIGGEKLRKIKGADGQKLVDGHLVEMLAKSNPWISNAYELLNGFVHLSPQHFKSMMAQAVHAPGGIVTIQYLSGSGYVQEPDKAGVNAMFVKISEGVARLLCYWATHRGFSSATKDWLARAQAAGAA